jgi:hypothetical protein
MGGREPIAQDLVALRADSTLPELERAPRVPPGALNLRGRVERLASGLGLQVKMWDNSR